MEYTDFFTDLLLEHTKEILPDIFAAIEAEKDPMSGVHFSRGIPKNKPADIPKLQGEKNRLPHLGINKSPGHNDPLGIYAFPKEYVLSGGLKHNSGFYNSDYWYIIRPIRSKCKILNLSKLTDAELGELLKKMEIPEKYLTDPSVYHKSNKSKTPGHMLWGIMEKYKQDNKNWNNFGWNKLFKKADVNVFLDEGDSIIHSNEPSQIVYMEPGTYEVIKTGTRRAKSSNVLAAVIKHFPEYRAVRGNPHGQSDTYIVTLTHPKLRGIQIRLEYYESSTPDLTVSIYGLGDSHQMKYTSYEGLYGQNYSYHLDPDKIAADIKNFIETNKDKYKPDYTNDLNARDSQIMKKISEYYKIALDKRNLRKLVKQYTHRGYPVKFELMAYDNKLQISISRYERYSSYNYGHVSGIDYTVYGGDVEAIMKAAFKSLEDQIESTKPYRNDWAFDINKTDALRTIKFLQQRVFTHRSKSPE
jgi:hypothetical protein